MALVICDGCTAFIDLDYDTDCFIKGAGSVDGIQCESCRENRRKHTI